MSLEVFGDLPLNLVLVRHGRSARNAASSAHRNEGIALPDWFKKEHDSFTVLAPEAIEQTEITGIFLEREFPSGFDRYITSDIPRAMHTAACLALTGAQWEVRGFWRERDWGEHMNFIDGVPEEYRPSHDLKELNPYQWGPRGGESMSTGVATRLRLEEFELRETPPANNVIVVSHGDFITGALKDFENVTISEWNARYLRRSREVANNMVVHLQRSAEVPFYQKLRGICAWDKNRSWNEGEWIDIHPQTKYSNAELLELAKQALPQAMLHAEVGGDF